MDDLRDLAGHIAAEVWMSGIIRRTDPGYSGTAIPEPYRRFDDVVSVFVKLQTRDGAVFLRLVKEHDHVPPPEMHVKLDPNSMLLGGE
jgi:hypothetical protein